MRSSIALRLGLTFLIAAELTCIALSQARGGSTPQRGSTPQAAPRSGGTSAPRGAGGNRGPAGGRGERRGPKRDTPEIDDGLTTTYVTVTGSGNKAVPGLNRSNFKVLEDGVEQQIEAFSVESGPITVGFVVGGDPVDFKGIAPAFLKATPWDDEYFVLTDDGHPPGGTVIQNFTTDVQRVPKIFLPGGVTPDSIYVGLDYLKEGANRRKMLLLFGGSLNTDGTARNGLDPNYVVRMATKEGVQVYSVLTNNSGGTDFDDGGTSDIAPLTGGRSYTTFASSGTLETIAEEIARGLTVQYFIGYRSTNQEKDGKWRGIKVQVVNPPEGLGKLRITARSGYYAEKEKKAKK